MPCLNGHALKTKSVINVKDRLSRLLHVTCSYITPITYINIIINVINFDYIY